MSGFWLVSYILLWLVVLVQGFGIFSLFHHFGSMYIESREGRDSQGPPVGTALLPGEEQAIDGAMVRWPAQGAPTLVLFFGTDCGICTALKAMILPRLVDEHPDVQFVILCGGRRGEVENWAQAAETAIPVVPDPRFKTATRYRVALTPFCVATDADGVVRWRGIASNEAILEHAIHSARRAPEDGEVLRVTEVPSRASEVSA